MKLLILVAMLFCHCIADYNIQGILASFKQKSWWKENAPDELYKHDWIIALIEHSFVWTCFIFIPVLVYCLIVNEYKAPAIYVVLFLAQWAIHIDIDDEKANRHRISLLQDQIFHILQVVCVWACCILL